MIISKRPAPLDDHLQEDGSSRWSFAAAAAFLLTRWHANENWILHCVIHYSVTHRQLENKKYLRILKLNFRRKYLTPAIDLTKRFFWQLISQNSQKRSKDSAELRPGGNCSSVEDRPKVIILSLYDPFINSKRWVLLVYKWGWGNFSVLENNKWMGFFLIIKGGYFRDFSRQRGASSVHMTKHL